jgi:GDPmannose 4,6-dehydratase
MKRALITGITGQDGSYLTELLLEKGYEVHGIIRRASSFNTDRIDHLYEDPHERGRRLVLHYGDLSDATVLRRVLEKARPQELYNLDSVRDYQERTGDEVRVYQAGSSEMFGAAPAPQSEDTPFYPRSPYAVSKVAAHWYGVNYREAYDLFLCNGILFNHESPRRGETFVTRKITRAVGRIAQGLQQTLYLGNLEAKRDWGFAGDYVEAMWRMLQQDAPDDYVIATGEAHTVREFVEAAFAHAGLDPADRVEIDPRYFRPTEVDYLQGDPSRARDQLGWEPAMSFQELVRIMVDHDMELARQERTLKDAGHTTPLRGAASQ